MQHFSIAPAEMVASVWRNRYLIKTSIQREVVGRYRGSFMGILWSFFNPVFMLVVYTFVFSVVFKARWHTGSDSKTEFALILFSGLIVFNLFSECVNRAPWLIISHANYVKKVVFPLEILPVISLGSAFFHTAISLLVWVIAYMLLFGTPHVSLLMFPVVAIPLLLFTLGISWGLASLGVYLRDVSQVIGVVTTAMLFLSPVFYSTSTLPENYQSILLLNPMTHIIEMTRNVMFFGKFPELDILIGSYFISLIIASLGFAWFQKTRKGFADVL